MPDSAGWGSPDVSGEVAIRADGDPSLTTKLIDVLRRPPEAGPAESLPRGSPAIGEAAYSTKSSADSFEYMTPILK